MYKDIKILYLCTDTGFVPTVLTPVITKIIITVKYNISLMN